jgi:hypothetical protein
VSSSIAFCPKEQSPSRQIICTPGWAVSAPAANGTPTAIAPNGPGIRLLAENRVGID